MVMRLARRFVILRNVVIWNIYIYINFRISEPSVEQVFALNLSMKYVCFITLFQKFRLLISFFTYVIAKLRLPLMSLRSMFVVKHVDRNRFELCKPRVNIYQKVAIGNMSTIPTISVKKLIV
jgi:hypothetical protein